MNKNKMKVFVLWQKKFFSIGPRAGSHTIKNQSTATSMGDAIIIFIGLNLSGRHCTVPIAVPLRRN
jgi:hypothetical protein